LCSAEAAADEPQSEHAEDVERDRREMGRGKRVPLAAPPEEEIARDVGLVRDRTIGVSLWIRRLAASVRLDALADLPGGICGAARFQLALDREVPPRRLPVHDAFRADHPRVADVDDVRRLHVEADAEAAEEDRRGKEDPGRPDGAGRRAAPGHTDPHTA